MDAEPQHELICDSRFNGRMSLAAAFILLVLVIGALVSINRPKAVEKFQWLTPAQMPAADRPGPLERFRWWAMRSKVAGPLGRYFRSRAPHISTGMARVPAQPSFTITFATPIATNAEGTLAWVLSESQLASFWQLLTKAEGQVNYPGGRITTLTGLQASVMTGGDVPAIMKDGTVTNIFVGLNMVVMPRIESGAVRVLANLVSTDVSRSETNEYSLVAAATVCASALIPNGGALVCKIAGTDHSRGTNYWIVVPTIATDSKGKKMKL